MSTPCFAFDLVTFDVGGTLLTFRPDLPAGYVEALAALGIAIDQERLVTALAEGRRQADRRRLESVSPDHRVSVETGNARRRRFVLDVLRHAGVPELDLERAADAIQAAYDSPRMYTVYDDAMPAVRELWNRGLKLGVIANTWPSMPRILLQLGFGDYLGFWVISELVGVEKPHPAIFERALEIGATPAARTLHVGDDYARDFIGAREAGLQAVLLDRQGGAPDHDEEGHPIPIIHRLDTLLDAIG